MRLTDPVDIDIAWLEWSNAIEDEDALRREREEADKQEDDE